MPLDFPSTPSVNDTYTLGNTGGSGGGGGYYPPTGLYKIHHKRVS